MKIHLRFEDRSDFTIDRDSYHQLGVTTGDVTMPCSSSGHISGRWRGLPMASLLEDSRIPDATTHVQFTSSEEYTVCLKLYTLWDSMIAFERLDPETNSGLPRLVGPRVGAHQSVKRITSLQPLVLEPDDNVRDYESTH